MIVSTSIRGRILFFFKCKLGCLRTITSDTVSLRCRCRCWPMGSRSFECHNQWFIIDFQVDMDSCMGFECKENNIIQYNQQCKWAIDLLWLLFLKLLLVYDSKIKQYFICNGAWMRTYKTNATIMNCFIIFYTI